jgi:hypothetical protein
MIPHTTDVDKWAYAYGWDDDGSDAHAAGYVVHYTHPDGACIDVVFTNDGDATGYTTHTTADGCTWPVRRDDVEYVMSHP